MNLFGLAITICVVGMAFDWALEVTDAEYGVRRVTRAVVTVSSISAISIAIVSAFN